VSYTSRMLVSLTNLSTSSNFSGFSNTSSSAIPGPANHRSDSGPKCCSLAIARRYNLL
jgi:hypothetical protein